VLSRHRRCGTQPGRKLFAADLLTVVTRFRRQRSLVAIQHARQFFGNGGVCAIRTLRCLLSAGCRFLTQQIQISPRPTKLCQLCTTTTPQQQTHCHHIPLPTAQSTAAVFLLFLLYIPAPPPVLLRPPARSSLPVPTR